MNIEENRLATFNDWPSSAAVSPSRLAKAGFFYLKEGENVECFSCHINISSWNYENQVMALHKTRNPNCPFVLDPSTSGNVPISININIPSTSDDFKSEFSRLKTFENWPIPHIVNPNDLAEAGFYYLKKDDNTKCAFCNGVVRAWEPGDNPDKEHKRHFEDCPYVISVITPRLSSQIGKNLESDVNNLVNNTDENLRLGIQPHKGPKHSCFTTVESRLKTFYLWPIDLIQTPQILAQAGFYYDGPPGDQVRCFHCDGGLRDWDPTDDPWTEHARWFPRCAFIRLIKGQEFVNACSSEHNTLNNNLKEVNKKCSRHPNLPPRKREVTDRELQVHMTSDVALLALSIGLNVERVKRAIREKLEQTGRGYSHPDALVEAALNLQHEEDNTDELSIPTTTDQPSTTTTSDYLIDDFLQNNNNNNNTNRNNNEHNTVVANNKEENDCEKKNEKSISLEEENRILKEARLCKICMDVEVGIVFLPCGHLATCVNCAPNLEDCPVCRSSIKTTIRTFLS